MTSILRVVMPALTYVPGEMGGSETYFRALVAGLDRRSDIDLTVLLSEVGRGASGARTELVVPRSRGGSSTRQRLVTILRGLHADRDSARRIATADVVHYPFTVPVPAAHGRPWVQTLHDVQHLDLPKLFSRPERRYRAVAYDGPARRSDAVITMSAYCKARINQLVHVAPEKTFVSHLGVDPVRFPWSTAPRRSYVFYPAAGWPHKNHARLIEAMTLVRRERPELRLVLTGGRREALGELPDWVDHRGYVNEEELIAIYGSAACLAFPSLYEGFGLPVLEASARGLRLAVARSGSLSEISPDWAVMFDPLDAHDQATAILKALTMAPPSREMCAQHIADFSWERCVEAHVDVYRRVAARGDLE